MGSYQGTVYEPLFDGGSVARETERERKAMESSVYQTSLTFQRSLRARSQSPSENSTFCFVFVDTEAHQSANVDNLRI